MIIALTGKAGSGKTTVAEYLVREHGYIKINFKDALLKELNQNFPDLIRELQTLYKGSVEASELFSTKPPIVRALMQNYGTEVRRGDDVDYWVNKWNTSIWGALNAGQKIVVDDCRFLNEADAVLMQGGDIIRLDSNATNYSEHQSETEMDNLAPNVTFFAEMGDVESLYSQIEKYVQGKKV